MSEAKPDHAQPATGEPNLSPAETKTLLPDEFYFDGPYMVFTEIYHQRRGYCCNSGCRHCPYR